MTSGNKQVIVGNFFERVAHRIFGGELSRNGNGDICLWECETTIEVKSSSLQSSYGFRLDVEQIARYERLALFPFSTALYALFAYRNQSTTINGRHCTGLSLHTTATTINNYLAHAITWGAVVDIAVVSQWKQCLPRSTKSILGHMGTETVDVKCSALDRLVNGDLRRQLELLELSPQHFTTLTGTVNLPADAIYRHRLTFPLTIIAPHRKIMVLRKTLLQRSILTEKRSV